MEVKVCNDCNIEKPIEMFCKNKGSKDGYNFYCKECASRRMAKWRSENKAHEKLYIEKNKKHISERGRIYREENSKQIRERVRAWEIDNKELIAEKKKKYRQQNKARLSEYAKQYSLDNKDVVNIKTNRYRARKRTLAYNLTLEQWNEIKEHFNYKCAYCGKEGQLEQDHFIPVTKGGEYTKNNIIPACRSCNASKNNSSFTEWYIKSGSFNRTREEKILNYLSIL